MKKIKVYLQKPWKTSDSAYYTYLNQNLPNGIEFVNYKDDGVIHKKSKFIKNVFLKSLIRKIIIRIFPSMPNAHLTNSKQDYDLIHCGHCLSLNRYKPWVADIEHAGQFLVSGGHELKKYKKLVRKILLRKNCKKILAWTEWSKKSILQYFPEIKNKVEIVYPAVPLKREKKIHKKNKITILYATRYFWLKGGLISLETMKRIKEKYGGRVEIIFISDVPKKIKNRYPEIKIQNIVPQKKLFEYYKRADIFFYPSFSDTFGFGILEAMSYGLPIVALKTPFTPSINELVSNKKHGLIFEIGKDLAEKVIKKKKDLKFGRKEQSLINSLIGNCSELFEKKVRMEKMTKNCINEIAFGKFSIKERNKKLERVYSEAVSR